MTDYQGVSPDIQAYVQADILPRYETFDKAHRPAHALTVIANCLEIAQDHPVNRDMVYVIAAYHDLGLCGGRQGHERRSGEILLEDQMLRRWFSAHEITVMAQAAEDHRASNKHEPRSLYGKIVAEGDRDISFDTILRRTLQYGMAEYPQMTVGEHVQRAYEHIRDKYGPEGYLTLWLEAPKNLAGLREIYGWLEKPQEMMNIARGVLAQLAACPEGEA